MLGPPGLSPSDFDAVLMTSVPDAVACASFDVTHMPSLGMPTGVRDSVRDVQRVSGSGQDIESTGCFAEAGTHAEELDGASREVQTLHSGMRVILLNLVEKQRSPAGDFFGGHGVHAGEGLASVNKSCLQALTRASRAMTRSPAQHGSVSGVSGCVTVHSCLSELQPDDIQVLAVPGEAEVRLEGRQHLVLRQV